MQKQHFSKNCVLSDSFNTGHSDQLIQKKGKSFSAVPWPPFGEDYHYYETRIPALKFKTLCCNLAVVYDRLNGGQGSQNHNTSSWCRGIKISCWWPDILFTGTPRAAHRLGPIRASTFSFVSHHSAATNFIIHWAARPNNIKTFLPW